MNKLHEILMQAVGEASLCWEDNTSPVGIFDTESAIKIANNTLQVIRKEVMECLGEETTGKNEGIELGSYDEGFDHGYIKGEHCMRSEVKEKLTILFDGIKVDDKEIDDEYGHELAGDG